ncbi:hypothetical protein OROHE_027590 [Orobanche hederae]
MAKAIPRARSRRNIRIGSRRNIRISSHRNVRRISKGIIHVQSSFNNTIVTVTDIRVDAIQTVDIQRAEVMIKGPGLGRDAALRAIRRSGILLTCVRDVTPMPHNGCRPPKKRRI